jgi:hypothetical protein
VPGTDPASPELRAQFEAFHPPPADAPPELAAAAKSASTDAYHLAALVGATLMLAGAGVNAVGLRVPARQRGETADRAAAAEGGGATGG